MTQKQQYDNRCEEYYWLVSDCHVDPTKVGQLTRREIEQLKHGAEKLHEKQERQMNSTASNPTRPSKVKRENEALAQFA